MKFLKLYEQFEDEEEWWKEPNIYDEDKLENTNNNFKKYDKVFILDGLGKGKYGYIEDIGGISYGIRAGKYFVCSKNAVRRMTPEEIKRWWNK